MRDRVWLFYVLAAGSLGHLGASDDSPLPHLRSPQGKVEFSFDAPRYDMTVDPDKEKPTAGLRTAHYNVTFYQPGSRTVVATSDYYDIQASKDQPFPTPVSELAGKMIWSPQEEFTVLPLEKWPPEKKKNVRRRAVSLNPDFPWQTKDFLLEDAPLVWTNSRVVVGNSREGCALSVAAFNARTGKTSTLSDAALPAGYTMASSSGQSILMKKVLSPCATSEDARTFVPECTILDLRFDRKQIGLCPP